MLLPLAGQQSWPRDQSSSEGPAGARVRAAGRQFLELGLARLHGISPEGIKANGDNAWVEVTIRRGACLRFRSFEEAGGEKG